MASEKIIFTSKQKEYLLEEFESIGNDSSIARTFKELYNDPRDVAAIRKSINRLRNKGIKQAARDAEVSTQDVKHLWLKQDGASLFIKNPDFQEGDKDQFALDLIESLKSHVPKYEKFKREKSKDGHLLVIDPCDLHIGKLASAFETGENYNSQIAVQRALEGVDGILEKCGFEIDQILFIGGNDILHIDTPDRKTTSGTPQDTDGMWYNNFLIAKKLYVDILEKLLQVANVQFTFNPSNHDYTNGFFLADVIKTHFRNCDQIQFDCSISHRKYYRYHSNLIGTTHGDGAKNQDLPLLMAQESNAWSSTKHRYIYTHHVHHKIAKDFIGVTVESLRSASGTDSWHHRKGFQFAPKAVEGFVHSKIHGQVCRITHLF